MAVHIDELTETQMELQAVKAALRGGSDHLGMKGETLQQYLLQLNQKENILLSQKLRPANGESFVPLLPQDGYRGLAAPIAPSGAGIAGTANGEVELPTLEPKPAPSGTPAVFDRENLSSVISHMTVYEALPQECAKALRALSTLAYADAQRVGGDDAAYAQLLRLLAIHRADATVQLNAMRAICNMAHNNQVALKRLVAPEILGSLLDAVSQNEIAKDSTDKASSVPKEVGVKASEAIARIIAAENPEDTNSETNARRSSEIGALGNVFLVASGGKAAWQNVLPRLIAQFVANEVVVQSVVAKSLVEPCQQCNATSAAGWLSLAKQLASSEIPELHQALLDAGAIRSAATLMEQFESVGPAQLAGVEAMSCLVGNLWAGLQAFAEVGGMGRIEAALRGHSAMVILQTKGCRALASGVQWPQDIQDKARYSWARAVELTKTAMDNHQDNAELQIAALEGLAKYLDKLQGKDKAACKDTLVNSDGEALVKNVMTKHVGDAKVQHWGKSVLGSIGADRTWTPDATAK